jgi:predicted DNA-binding transcriptional regulator YafY
MKPQRINRLVEILTTLQAGRYYAADELAKMFQTSRRTIFRDLKELQTIGIPYRYDADAGGYKIDPEFYLPPLDLNLKEALSLLMLVHKTAGGIVAPFKNSLLLAALKIENNLPEKIRKYCNEAMQNVSAHLEAQAPTEKLDTHFSLLQRAISGKRRVYMKYHSLFENEVIDAELCPYHLHFNRRAWYVIGFSSLHQSVRTFKLNRIVHLKLTDNYFKGGNKFSAREYLGRAWSIIPEGRIYYVKLRFLPKVANNVIEVRWHSTQKVQKNPDGSADIEFRIDGLGEIVWWILGYGDQVQIIRPKALRQKIHDIAQKMVEMSEE